MKVSGFTFCRDAVRFDYPIVESIRSILPIVDEYVVNVGKCDDGTLELVRSIGDPKIRIVESVWDDSLIREGRVFGAQQDIALAHCSGDWAFCLQADEVVHEDDLPTIRAAMERYLDQSHVVGLIFRMWHFKGDYWSLDPWMYRKATRIVRTRVGVRSATDGCDFVAVGSSTMLKATPDARLIPARIFHYGWVKDARVLEAKLQFQISRHDGEHLSSEQIAEQATLRARYPQYDILREFRGTHPGVMHERVNRAARLRTRSNRWFNWKFYREIFAHGFKG